MPLLLVPLTVQWWATWYPGSEPGGGSYVAQRMLAARDERHALGATLWFNVAHYALRPWPWILVALSSLLVFPQLADVQRALPHVDPALIGHDIAYPAMLTFLPHGLLGLVVAALLRGLRLDDVDAPQLGRELPGARLLPALPAAGRRPSATTSPCRGWSRPGLMVGAAGGVWVIGTAGEGFQLMLSIGAGTGLLYLLRWYWWRINAWSEIAAMASSFVIAVGGAGRDAAGRGVPAHWVLLGAVVVDHRWCGCSRPSDPAGARGDAGRVRAAHAAGRARAGAGSGARRGVDRLARSAGARAAGLRPGRRA